MSIENQILLVEELIATNWREVQYIISRNLWEAYFIFIIGTLGNCRFTKARECWSQTSERAIEYWEINLPSGITKSHQWKVSKHKRFRAGPGWPDELSSIKSISYFSSIVSNITGVLSQLETSDKFQSFNSMVWRERFLKRALRLN